MARLALRTPLYRKGVTATHFMCGVGDTWARILVSTGIRKGREASGSPGLPHQRDLK